MLICCKTLRLIIQFTCHGPTLLEKERRLRHRYLTKKSSGAAANRYLIKKAAAFPMSLPGMAVRYDTVRSKIEHGVLQKLPYRTNVTKINLHAYCTYLLFMGWYALNVLYLKVRYVDQSKL